MPAYGSIGWFEIGTDDPATAERFYGEVFGWTVSHDDALSPDPAYRIISTGTGTGTGSTTDAGAGLRAGALFDTRGAVPGYAVFTVLVEDVEATCRRVEQAGGQVQRGPETNPVGVRFAHLLDPAGNHLAVFTPPARAPEQPAPVQP